MGDSTAEPAAMDPIRELRRHYEGSLVFDGHAAAVRFVIDDATGALVMPVEPVVLTASEHVLFVPEERDGAVECMLSVAGVDAVSGPYAAACDRWGAYHGKTVLRTWAAASMGGAKWNGRVYDEPELMRANPLRGQVGMLCRVINGDPDALAAACQRIAAVEVSDPMAVGVDPGGVDVRARFGVVRLEFEEEAGSVEAARGAIGRLIAGGSGA